MSQPALTPPPGGNENIGPNLEAAALSTLIIAVIVVTLRLYVRARVVRSVGIDDYLMLFALALAIVATGVEFVATRHDFGQHAYYVSKANGAVIGKYLAFTGAFCNLSLTFAKLSIIATLLRILNGSREKAWQIFLWIFAFTILGVNVTVTATQFAQCSPAYALWDRTAGSCWNPKIQQNLAYLQGAYSAFTDFALCLLPIIVFRNLNMSKSNRNALIGVMSLGLVTGALAIARTVQTWRFSGVNDSTWTSVTLLMLSGLERNFAIILASVPPCRPLLRQDWSFTPYHSLKSFISGGSSSGTIRSESFTTMHKGTSYEKATSSDESERAPHGFGSPRQSV